MLSKIALWVLGFGSLSRHQNNAFSFGYCYGTVANVWQNVAVECYKKYDLCVASSSLRKLSPPLLQLQLLNKDLENSCIENLRRGFYYIMEWNNWDHIQSRHPPTESFLIRYTCQTLVHSLWRHRNAHVSNH